VTLAYNRAEQQRMTEPRPTPSARLDDASADLDRDAKVDELLLAGLEHYFSDRHQEAINVWGRVLFLDRGHARARAYIERARGALAERQRKADELVHEGVAALQRGDGPAARQLLETAVEQGDTHDMARAYLERLDRLSTSGPENGQIRLAAAPGAPAPPPAVRRRGLLAGAPRPVRVLPILLAAALIVIAMFVAASRDLLKPLMDLAWRQPAATSAVSVTPDVLPVPGSADLAMSRARELLAGPVRLKAALAALDGVSEADPRLPDVQRMRAEIQRALIESVRSAAAVPPAPASAARRDEGRQ
jgi:hypothetical protein